ncbi:MAG: hydrogenase expression/formation protein HypE [Candidatus Hydrogenedentes bacterium]|nr:hydrogenase expression/formation protein HypE [Candidatus Hydrogenedentota bacterium]
MTGESLDRLQCPVPVPGDGGISLAHGGGGRLTRNLISGVFHRHFDNPALQQRHDAAVTAWEGGQVAFTTDSFVVKPLFFPGGDIGRLAVCGTVNDLAMAGAVPLWLSAAFILEEGLPLGILERVVASMAATAHECGVAIVTGDTKVVDKGSGDSIFITTAGIGSVIVDPAPCPALVREGDALIVSGDLGRHGIAVMAAREGLSFTPEIESDAAPLCYPVQALLAAHIEVHCLRDLTRGGLAAAVKEIAEDGAVAVTLEEPVIPVGDCVGAACELLGLDPLYVANEGRFLAVVPSRQADETLGILRRSGCNPAHIGQVRAGSPGEVVLRSAFGTSRVLDLLSGEQLPRIC